MQPPPFPQTGVLLWSITMTTSRRNNSRPTKSTSGKTGGGPKSGVPTRGTPKRSAKSPSKLPAAPKYGKPGTTVGALRGPKDGVDDFFKKVALAHGYSPVQLRNYPNVLRDAKIDPKKLTDDYCRRMQKVCYPLALRSAENHNKLFLKGKAAGSRVVLPSWGNVPTPPAKLLECDSCGGKFSEDSMPKVGIENLCQTCS